MAAGDVAETREYLSPPPAYNAEFRPFKAVAAHNFEPYVDVGLKGKGLRVAHFIFIYVAFSVQHGTSGQRDSVCTPQGSVSTFQPCISTTFQRGAH